MLPVTAAADFVAYSRRQRARNLGADLRPARSRTEIADRQEKVIAVPIKKRPGRNSFAVQRELAKLAKTMALAQIVKRTGRTPASILKTARQLGIAIKGRK